MSISKASRFEASSPKASSRNASSGHEVLLRVATPSPPTVAPRRALRGVVLPILLATVLLSIFGCGSARRDDPILKLSATESLVEGKRLLEDKKYRVAKKYLLHAFEVEPNSASGRDGLLLAADALFDAGGSQAWIESESRYRDFLNRFPTSPRADYAQLRVAQSLARRMEKPNRDQEVTRKAYKAFEDLVRLYPTSDKTDLARMEMTNLRQVLAEHEWVVAHYYFRASGGGKRSRRLATPAVARMEYLLDNYPDYSQKDKIYAHLCRAHDRLEQPEKAAEACATLKEQFPQSKYIEKLPKDLRALDRKDEAAAGVGAVEPSSPSGSQPR